MDRESFSHYGWIVIVVIILSVMLALATPFGQFVAGGFNYTVGTFTHEKEVAETFFDEFPKTPIDIKREEDLTFYDSVRTAIGDVNNDEIGKNEKNIPFEQAVAAVYINDEGVPVVYLLKDVVETSKILVTREQIINLGGRKFKFEGTPTGLEIVATAPNPISVSIDGRILGSEMSITYTRACLVYANSDATNPAEGYINLFVKGGRYCSYATTNNQTITFFVRDYCKTRFEDISIDAASDQGNAYCFRNGQGADTTIKNVQAFADARYGTNADVTYYSALSIAVSNYGTVKIKNCNMGATHSAISSSGVAYVDGGVYESIGHGGAYFGKLNGYEGIAYIKNATFRQAESYKGRYDLIDPEVNSSWNKSGMYIGGHPEAHGVKVYADNCYFQGKRHAISIRWNADCEERNLSLYISNSKINMDSEYKISLRHPTHTLYIGKGNNFGVEDVTFYPERVVITDEVYDYPDFE